MKCKRCTYHWLPVIGERIIPRNGNTYFVDLGICPKCDNAKSRVHVASPGDIASAMLWGRQFELKRMEDEE